MLVIYNTGHAFPWAGSHPAAKNLACDLVWRAGARVATRLRAVTGMGSTATAPYSTGANPAPNAVKIRVIRVLKPTLTSGKSPTGR